MLLAKKLAIAILFIAGALATMQFFHLGGRGEDSLIFVVFWAVGSILLLATVVVFHFIWRDHQQ